MTNREMLAFKDKLESAKSAVLSATADVLESNEAKIYAKTEALHKSYPTKDQKLVELKRRLVADYAKKDKAGNAVVSTQTIGGRTVVDYDYGDNRTLVGAALLTWVTANKQRRQTIDGLWDAETDVKWDMLDDKDIPAELKEDLLPITRDKELSGTSK